MGYKYDQLVQYINDNGLESKSRKQKLVDKRTYLFEYMRRVGAQTYSDIGDHFNRDHSTVIHGINKYKDMKTDPLFILNCSELMIRFPIKDDMGDFRRALSSNGHNKIELVLDGLEFMKVEKYRIENRILTNKEALRHMIDTCSKF